MGQAVAAAVIKDTPPSPGGTIRLKQAAGGRALPVTIGVAQNTERYVLTAQDIAELQKRIPGLSNNSRKAICTWINEKLGRGTIESGFTKILSELDKLYLEYFEIKEFEFENKDGIFELLPAFVCKDLLAFTKRVNKDRNYDIDHTLCKFGIDKGQGFLKFTYSIVDLFENEEYHEHFLSTGVNKLFLLAILHPKLEENHHNFKVIMSHMNIWDCQEHIWENGGDFLFHGDYKALNILGQFSCHTKC